MRGQSAIPLGTLAALRAGGWAFAHVKPSTFVRTATPRRCARAYANSVHSRSIAMPAEIRPAQTEPGEHVDCPAIITLT